MQEDGPLHHSRKASDTHVFAFVCQLSIDLVADNDQILFDRKPSDLFQFALFGDTACWVTPVSSGMWYRRLLAKGFVTSDVLKKVKNG